MNIALLTTEYITEAEYDGGLSNYLSRLVRCLASRGHSVELFTLSDQDGEILHEGVPVHRVRNNSQGFEFLNRLTRYRFKRTFRFLSLSYCLKQRFNLRQQEKQFDVIQAASCFACGLFCTFGLSVPVITRVSSVEFLFREFYRRPLTVDQRICEWLELLVMKRSDAVYAPSRYISQVLQKKKVIADVIRTPYLPESGVSDESVCNTRLAGRKYLLFYGSIGFLKGCEVLAKSLTVTLKNFPDMYFVFAGKVMEGPEGVSMMDYILKEVGTCADRVLCLGSLRHPQLDPVIRNAQAVVLPSLTDNLPNTMIESMAFGKVVIGTRGISFDELIEDNVSGFLVSPGDVTDLARVMSEVWRLPEADRQRIGEEAAMRTAILAPDRVCAELEKYYQQVMARKLSPDYET